MLFQLLFDIILSHISLDTTEIETKFAISLQICRYLFVLEISKLNTS